MKMRIKKYCIGALFIASASIGFYACSADQQGWEEDIENELELKSAAMSRSLKLETRSDSVMDSEEFMDYMVAYQALKSKMNSFFGSLTESEMGKMREAAALSNVEDERCMVEVDKFYNFTKSEMDAYRNAVRNLLENTSFLKLSEEERIALFKNALVSMQITPMKSRSAEDRCEEYKRLLAQTESDFMNTMVACFERYGPQEEGGDYDPEYARCMFNARMTYENRLKWLSEEYRDCI